MMIEPRPWNGRSAAARIRSRSVAAPTRPASAGAAATTTGIATSTAIAATTIAHRRRAHAGPRSPAQQDDERQGARRRQHARSPAGDDADGMEQLVWIGHALASLYVYA
ncbi:hypothetical protein [Dactylosporangium fulvum]|uniref:hypothetical protein n=1 Tax=Dactylosporangium fulvum TaxID=53359 RepID=UPI0031D11FD6